jgi:hypothetical protein
MALLWRNHSFDITVQTLHLGARVPGLADEAGLNAPQFWAIFSLKLCGVPTTYSLA